MDIDNRATSSNDYNLAVPLGSSEDVFLLIIVTTPPVPQLAQKDPKGEWEGMELRNDFKSALTPCASWMQTTKCPSQSRCNSLKLLPSTSPSAEGMKQ